MGVEATCGPPKLPRAFSPPPPPPAPPRLRFSSASRSLRQSGFSSGKMRGWFECGRLGLRMRGSSTVVRAPNEGGEGVRKPIRSRNWSRSGGGLLTACLTHTRQLLVFLFPSFFFDTFLVKGSSIILGCSAKLALRGYTSELAFSTDTNLANRTSSTDSKRRWHFGCPLPLHTYFFRRHLPRKARVFKTVPTEQTGLPRLRGWLWGPHCSTQGPTTPASKYPQRPLKRRGPGKKPRCNRSVSPPQKKRYNMNRKRQCGFMALNR